MSATDRCSVEEESGVASKVDGQDVGVLPSTSLNCENRFSSGSSVSTTVSDGADSRRVSEPGDETSGGSRFRPHFWTFLLWISNQRLLWSE